MSSQYKIVPNGRGTNLTIGDGMYISVGKNGEDVTIRGTDKVLSFHKWNDFVNAINEKKADYCRKDDRKQVVVGKCKILNGVMLELRREYYRQGLVFKDYNAFYNDLKKPCYVPETDETVYTREDFLRICNSQEDIAEMMFEEVDWQHPETWLEEQYNSGELDVCDNCGRIFESYDALQCSHCGAVCEKLEG